MSSTPDFPAPSPDQSHDRYGFFLEPPKPQKSKLPSLGNMGTAPKILAIVAGALFVVIILFVLYSALFGSKDNSAPLVTVSNDQQQLLHVLDDGAKSVSSDQLSNFTVTAQASLMTAHSQLSAYLVKINVKVKSSTTAESTITDQTLLAAQTTDTYDETFTTVMKDSLNNYVTDLQTASTGSTGKIAKQLLEKQTADAQLLIRQLGN